MTKKTYHMHVSTTFEVEADSVQQAIDKLWQQRGIYQHEIDSISEDSKEISMIGTVEED